MGIYISIPYISIDIIDYWLVVSIPLKNMLVSWDDDIPNIWKAIKVMFQTTNQYIYIYIPYISIDYISTSHLWDFY